MGENLGGLLLTSVEALLPVFVIVAIGVYLVRKGVFDESSGRALSRTSTWVLVPSLLIVRMGGSLSPALIAEVWVLPVGGALVIALHFLIGRFVLTPIARPSKGFRPWFVYSMTFGNLAALPLIFITSLCKTGEIRKPGSGTEILSPDECVELGETYLFIFIIVPNMLLFVVGHMIEHVQRAAYKKQEMKIRLAEEGKRSVESDATRTEDTSREISGDENEGNELAVVTRPRKASEEYEEREFLDLYEWIVMLRITLTQPSVAASLVALFIALIGPLQSFFFDDNSFVTPFMNTVRLLATGVVAVLNFTIAIILGVKVRKTSWINLLGSSDEGVGISRRSLVVFTFGRMVLIPGVSYLIIFLIQDKLPNNQMLLIILYFLTSTPTANLCAIIAPTHEGEVISLGMIHQYVIGAITLPMWCFLALLFTS